eukprot:9596946-Alexandrium_andersonii.AAC.1
MAVLQVAVFGTLPDSAKVCSGTSPACHWPTVYRALMAVLGDDAVFRCDLAVKCGSSSVACH